MLSVSQKGREVIYLTGTGTISEHSHCSTFFYDFHKCSIKLELAVVFVAFNSAFMQRGRFSLHQEDRLHEIKAIALGVFSFHLWIIST